jgi:hypothetical protein
MRLAENIQEVIDLLHIDVIGLEIEIVHDQIREAYQVPTVIVDDYEEFKAVVTHYYQYHFAKWHGIEFDMPPDMAWSRAREILDARIRPDSRLARISGNLESTGGWIQAVKNAIRGRQRGLIGVIDAIAESMKEAAVKQYVTAVFLDCINPVDFYTKVAFMQEYIQRYGSVVLPGEELLSPYELAANLDAVIQNHVRLINQFRNTLQ